MVLLKPQPHWGQLELHHQLLWDQDLAQCTCCDFHGLSRVSYWKKTVWEVPIPCGLLTSEPDGDDAAAWHHRAEGLHPCLLQALLPMGKQDVHRAVTRRKAALHLPSCTLSSAREGLWCCLSQTSKRALAVCWKGWCVGSVGQTGGFHAVPSVQL